MGERSVCASIGTLNDLLYEEDETFTVSLTSSNPSVNIGVSSTIVDIRDNDGGFVYFIPHLGKIIVIIKPFDRCYCYVGAATVLLQ